MQLEKELAKERQKVLILEYEAKNKRLKRELKDKTQSCQPSESLSWRKEPRMISYMYVTD